MTKHLNIRISGKVQGVFFRATTKEKADALGITGYVKNEEDGTVFIEAEAPEDTLKELVEWCHRGPSDARVDKVLTSEGPLQYFKNFEDRRRK